MTTDVGAERGRVAVIGAGSIGLGWITLFLAHGYRVRVNSTRSNIETVIHDALRLFTPGLPGASRDPADLAGRLEIEPDLERAVADVAVVQENTPENLEIKQDLFARLEKHAAAGTLLLSSTSTMLPADLGARMDNPSHLIVGHPFNPPHVIPLVEVVGDTTSDPDAVSAAAEFYRSVGKTPVVLRRPIAAFAANRLQSALLQESIHLVREGVVTVAELDDIVTGSLGPRWATVGPFQSFHLGGGPGGLRNWLGTLGSGLQQGWAALGRPVLDEDTLDLVLDQTDQAFGGIAYEELAARRDRLQKAVLAAVASADDAPPPRSGS